jgi:hypothetical protein
LQYLRHIFATSYRSREGIAPTRGPEAKAPLATSAAPVALQQGRILQTSPQHRLQYFDCQSFAAARLQKSGFAQAVSGFAQALSGFVQAPTGKSASRAYWAMAGVAMSR